MKQAFEIAAIEYELGSQKLSNKEIRKKFVSEDNPAERIDHLVDDVLGKKTVYHLGETESIITLSVSACQKALEKAKMKSSDIDGIIFTGITHEFYSPTTAVVLSHMLGCREDLKCCIDMNANCICMVTALYQANAMMAADEEINNLLLVDCGYLSSINIIPDLVAACSVSDTATALLLTRRANPVPMYFEGYQDAKQYNVATAPEKGFTHFIRSKKFEAYGLSVNGDLDCEIDLVGDKISDYLTTWGVSDTKAFCFSQYVLANILALVDKLNLDRNKVPYIGDQIGYTGPSSPFLALKAKLDKNELKAGDKVFLWTVATGSQHAFCSITI